VFVYHFCLKGKGIIRGKNIVDVALIFLGYNYFEEKTNAKVTLKMRWTYVGA